MKKLRYLMFAAFTLVGFATEKGFQNYRLSKIIGGANCTDVGDGGNSCNNQEEVVGTMEGKPCSSSETANVCAEGKGQKIIQSQTKRLIEENVQDQPCPKGYVLTCLKQDGPTSQAVWTKRPDAVECGSKSVVSAIKKPADPDCTQPPPNGQ